MATLTLAAIYELQGLKEEALEIYKAILKKEPTNKEAQNALLRLNGVRKSYQGVNEEMKRLFIKMESEVEFNEFERWLVKPWN